MRTSGLLCCALLLAACSTPADGATTGSTGTTASSNTAGTGGTGGTTGTGGTGGASEGPLTSSGLTGSAGSSGSPSTGTGEGTSTTSSSSSGASSGDTGGGGACEPALGDYGPCDAVLGFAFDGVACTLRSGCDCAPDCDKFFADAASCALTCAEAGHCNPERVEAAALAMSPVQQGTYCDEVDVCAVDPAAHATFEKIFGMLTCEGMGFPCKMGEGESCHGLWAGELGPEEWLKTCAATLVDGDVHLYCVVFGP